MECSDQIVTESSWLVMRRRVGKRLEKGVKRHRKEKCIHDLESQMGKQMANIST